MISQRVTRTWVFGLVCLSSPGVLAQHAVNPVKSFNFSREFRVTGDRWPLADADLSTDGKQLALVWGNQLLVARLDTFKKSFYRTLPRLDPAVMEFYNLAFSPDGRTLAVGLPGKKVALLDPASGNTRKQLQVEGEITDLVYHPSGKQLLTVSQVNVNVHPYSFSAEVWDLQSFRSIQKLHLTWDQMVHAFHPTQPALLSSNLDGELHLVQTGTGKFLPYLNGITNAMVFFQFNADGSLLVTSESRFESPVTGAPDGLPLLSLWDTRTQKKRAQVSLKGHGLATRMRFLPDRQHLLFGTLEGFVVSYDLKNSKVLQAVQAHEGEILDMEVRGSHLITVTGLGEVKIWDLDSLIPKK